jgi:hypothetical protein
MRANHSMVKLTISCYLPPLFQLQGLYRLEWDTNMIMTGEEVRILTEALRFIWKYYIHPFVVEENYRNIQQSRRGLESYRYINWLNEKVQSSWDKKHNSALIVGKYDFKVKFQVCVMTLFNFCGSYEYLRWNVYKWRAGTRQLWIILWRYGITDLLAWGQSQEASLRLAEHTIQFQTRCLLDRSLK